MEHLWQDLKYGLRQLAKSPGFALVAIVAMGLGISSVATQISVVNALFYKGLPFPHSEDILHLERINNNQDDYNAEVPLLEFLEWEKEQEVFSDLCGYYQGTANLTLKGRVERYNGLYVSPNLFRLLGVEAHIGRTLLPEDAESGSSPVAVISHKVWSRDFEGDPEIVGTGAILNGRPVTIVGVMPESFDFPYFEEIWAPLLQQQKIENMLWGDPGIITLEVIGRINKSVSREEATAAMSRIAATLAETYPESNGAFTSVRIKPFIEEFFGNATEAMTLVMLAITFIILLIACANVANLLLARAVRRQREVAIRSAVGANRRRIMAQFLVESTLLAIVGSLLGYILAIYNVRGINDAREVMTTPLWIDFSIDLKVFFIVAAITITSGIVSGFLPAWKISRTTDFEILKDDVRTSSSLQVGMLTRILVIVQITVAAVAITFVFLFVRSVDNLRSIDYLYNPDEVLSARIGMFEEVYPTSESRADFVMTLLGNLNARPEVTAAGSSSRYRFLNTGSTYYECEHHAFVSDFDRPLASFQTISDGFMEAMQLPILEGRGFLPGDYTPDSRKVALVSRALAEREWPNKSAVGQRFKPNLTDLQANGEPVWVEIIGVVEGMNERGLHRSKIHEAAFYLPHMRSAFPLFMTIALRGPGDPEALSAVLREEIARLDSNLPVYALGTPRDLNEEDTAQYGFFATIFMTFGVLATFLAALGIYGVISFSVNQRIVEFGIRSALGAPGKAIVSLVLSHAIKQLGIGLLIALFLLSPIILIPAVQESMQLFFYEVNPDSLYPYLFSFLFVSLIALFAALPPAFRAGKTDPGKVLRYE
jgi:putative ABC transport system permease protein